MLESSSTCPTPKYSHVEHTLEGSTSLIQQNYITNIALELKAKLAKIKVEVKEITKQLLMIHLCLYQSQM